MQLCKLTIVPAISIVFLQSVPGECECSIKLHAYIHVRRRGLEDSMLSRGECNRKRAPLTQTSMTNQTR